MSLKIVFFFALIVLACGLPAPPAEPASQDLQVLPVTLDSLLEDIFVAAGDNAAEPQSSDEKVLTRHRRACRSVSVRTRSGRVITVRRC